MKAFTKRAGLVKICCNRPSVNSQKRQRVVCGMSGGMDSSAPAALELYARYWQQKVEKINV
jgi:NH3-dependent NAD+ synthetase